MGHSGPQIAQTMKEYGTHKGNIAVQYRQRCRHRCYCYTDVRPRVAKAKARTIATIVATSTGTALAQYEDRSEVKSRTFSMRARHQLMQHPTKCKGGDKRKPNLSEIYFNLLEAWIE